MAKTTELHFAIFSEAVYKWQQTLGLLDWSIYLAHEADSEGYGSCTPNNTGRVATITLNTEWDDMRPITPGSLDTVALHEMLHLLLADLTWLIECRYLTESDIMPAEHAAIRRLEKALTGSNG